MRSVMRRALLLFVAGAVLAVPHLGATTVLEMNLEKLTHGAGLVFRGTVLDISETVVEAGGGEIPALRYLMRVDEGFKGDFRTVKGHDVAEFTVVGTLKKLELGQRVIPGFPLLRSGEEYLLMIAPDGPLGLTAVMGLGQGAFVFSTDGKVELVANERNNVGLFAGMAVDFPDMGPVSYEELAELIRALVAQEGGVQ